MRQPTCVSLNGGTSLKHSHLWYTKRAMMKVDQQ